MSQGQERDFKNAIKSYYLKPQSFYVWFMASSRGKQPKLI